MDDAAQRDLARADPNRVTRGESPILIDEWQRVPEVWDLVRREVDDAPDPNRFILTGSANPTDPGTHSGAGRILRIRMHPLSLAERGLGTPTVSVRELLTGSRPAIRGDTAITPTDYAAEIVASGFPALRRLSGRARRAQLESYVDRVIDKDFVELGLVVRNPELLRRWLRAYAAAVSTTATLETIRDAATAGEAGRPTRDTVLGYRSVLERLWLLEPVPAWLPSRNRIARLTQPDKHQLADPALAASLMGLTEGALLDGSAESADPYRDGSLFGRLFEALVTLSLRVYAQSVEAQLRHLRTKDGRHEIDLILARRDDRVIAVEVKLARTVGDGEVKHLVWLKDQLGSDLLDAVVVTAGPHAYRREDGIAVVPAVLLGP